MDRGVIERIVSEEMARAQETIVARLSLEFRDSLPKEHDGRKPLPSPKYKRALEMFRKSATYSAVGRDLHVTVLTAKRYFNWLVINGYLEAKQEDLSPRERDVVKLIYTDHKSLREAADALGCTVSNVVYFRNTALRKGYKPPHNGD
ncbi:MAG: helix-turn-helix transcriptional regulator [Ignavibacteriales bacterium]